MLLQPPATQSRPVLSWESHQPTTAVPTMDQCSCRQEWSTSRAQIRMPPALRTWSVVWMVRATCWPSRITCKFRECFAQRGTRSVPGGGRLREHELQQLQLPHREPWSQQKCVLHATEDRYAFVKELSVRNPLSDLLDVLFSRYPLLHLTRRIAPSALRLLLFPDHSPAGVDPHTGVLLPNDPSSPVFLVESHHSESQTASVSW